MLTTRVLTGPGLFAELAGDWRRLVPEAATATPFQTYEWMSTWWRHFGGAKEPQAIAVYEGRDLVGLFPATLTPGPWRTLRPMGLGPSDYLQPLARTGWETQVYEAIFRNLRERTDVDLVDLHQIREDHGCFEAPLGGQRVHQATCLLLDLPQTYDAYLASLGKSLRYDVRKLDKTLFIQGRARVERVDGAETQRGMSYLFELHRARWRKRRLPGAFLAKSIRFHREWAELSQRDGRLWLSVLHLDDQPIGAIYAMALGGTAYYYQAGFDPNRGSVSPGTLLVAGSIRRAIDEGMAHFDFMRGDEPYKRRWMPQHELRNFRTIAPARGALGRIGSKWNTMGFNVESRIRARLEGRGLV